MSELLTCPSCGEEYCIRLAHVCPTVERLRIALELACKNTRYGPDDWLLLAEGKQVVSELEGAGDE